MERYFLAGKDFFDLPSPPGEGLPNIGLRLRLEVGGCCGNRKGFEEQA